MSDIFDQPNLPDPIDVECPDCGMAKGTPCGSPKSKWNHGSRIWIVNSIAIIRELTQPEPTSASPSRDDYAAGWNDAILAIIERMRGKP